jgi:hypothetical protein
VKTKNHQRTSSERVTLSSTPTRSTQFDGATHFVRIVTTAVWGYDVFISYSRRDAAAYAQALQVALESHGLTVFRDYSDLDAGEALNDAVRKRLKRSRYVILLDTTNARRSRYVRDEIEYALGRSLHLVRVTFPGLSNSPDNWQLLKPFRTRLEQEIWLSDDSGAPLSAPTPAVVDDIRRTYRVRRVRSRFWRAVTVLVTLLSLGAAITAVSADARSRASAVLSAFRNPATPFDAALAATDRLFASPWYRVHDAFASDQHWELRNLLATLTLKRTENRAIDQRDNSCPDSMSQLDGLQEREKCVTYEPRLGVAAFVVAGEPEFRLWSPATKFGEPVRLDGPLADIEYIALSESRIATVTRGTITLWSRGTPIAGIADRAIPAIRDVEFSSDGRLLGVLSSPVAQSAQFILLDAATAMPLQQMTISARPSQNLSNAVACKPMSLAVTESGSATFRVCMPGGIELFEARPPSVRRRYSTAATPGALITGATHGPDGIAYWTWSDDVAVCEQSGACRHALAAEDLSPEVAAGSRGVIRRATFTPDAPNAPDGSLFVDDGVTLWKCRESPKRCDRMAAVSARQAVNEPQGPTVRSVDGIRDVGLLLASHDRRLIEQRRDGSVRLGKEGDWTDITPVGSASTAGAVPTCAAFSSSGSRVVLGFTSRTESFALVSDAPFTSWTAPTWRRYRALGGILSVKFDDDDEVISTLEMWGPEIVERQYPLGRSKTFELIRRR